LQFGLLKALLHGGLKGMNTCSIIYNVRYGEGDMKIWFEVLKEQSNFTFSVREKGKIRDETIINRYRARCINILGKTICICWGVKND
jgi:hypothetical protein